MKIPASREVLAFYSSEEGEQADRAYQSLRRSGSDACIVAGDTDPPTESCRFYAELRLEGEHLVTVPTEPSKIGNVVKTFRHAGTPSIFVIRPGVPVPRARTVRPVAAPRTRREILASLDAEKKTLDAARRDLREATRLDHALPSAAEWILDNSYLIRTQNAEVRRHLPRDLDRWITPGDGKRGVPALARELVKQCSFALTEANIRDFLRGHQAPVPLTIAELWAFPLFLRIALIEELTAIAARVAQTQQLRETAYLWANRLAGAARVNEESFARVLNLLESEPVALEPHFVAALAEQLQDEEQALGPVQRWIEKHFKSPITDLARDLHTKEAAQTVSTANAFGSLRALGGLPYAQIFEDVSVVEAELRTDPAGVYPRSDFPTRDRCRLALEQIARHSRESELDVARAAVRLARQEGEHVAYYLLSDGIVKLERETHSRVPLPKRAARVVYRHATLLYVAAIIALAVCFAAIAAVFAVDAGTRGYILLIALGALAIFPLSELAVQIVNALVVSLLPPEPLPKMDFRGGIPPENATLVVVPMMLSSLQDLHADLEKLEVRYLGNRNANLFYSLFADFTDAPQASTPRDSALLEAAKNGIAALNARYSVAADPTDRFLLFHRPRVWSESEQAWIGRERKRGKLEELNAFLCRDSGEGAPAAILAQGRFGTPISFVITLDADTQLPIEAARRLIETIAHPLNRIEIDAATRTRRRGYSVIQPRVSIALPGATATRFTRVFADSSGTDPYGRTVSDVHQDLFHEAMFHGKAIYDVHAFHTLLKGRFPDATILSHDLIEGAHVGVGLATDIELFEHLPIDYGSFADREHRWIRGDWQIARWTMPSVPVAGGKRERNPLTFINRWRIFDNLRRSLVPVASLLLLLLGWLMSPTPRVWSLIVALAVAIPAIAPLLDRLARKVEGSAQRWQGAADELIRTLVTIAFLPHQAWLAADAIVRVQYRLLVSHRKLLQWRTAARAHAESSLHMDATLRQLLIVSGLSVALSAPLLLKHAFLPACGFLVLWAASPLLMKWLSRPERHAYRHKLTDEDLQFLRGLSRRTWRFFDDLVSADRHWLPPDNSQLALRVEVAERTSPTNIGLWLIAALSARDFGYLTADEFCHRITQTMETLQRLERYEGHLLNWYDTKTTEPLNPRYVSTVDSGNLLACLWVLEQGMHDILRAPLIGALSVRGLTDTLSILEEKCGEDPSTSAAVHGLRRLLRGVREGHELIARFRMAEGPIGKLRQTHRWHSDEASKDERAYWANRLSNEFASWSATADRYLRWMETLAQPPDSTLRQLGPDAVPLRRRALHATPSIAALAEGSHTHVDSILEWRARKPRPEIAAWLEEVAAEYAAARARAVETVEAFRKISETATGLANGTDMRFLYDERVKLFGVGYAVGGPREFNSHYDLLASECRLASLVAIAKGDVPVEHWHAMARPYTRSKLGDALLSWSGTMFEYLMPLLFTRTFENSLLERACRDAVDRQIDYGRENAVPWGISESGYSAIDANRIYQYRAFGVPALALDPGCDGDLVVAPYATVLALQVNPPAAASNLSRLDRLGLLGPDGFYEAIDFTRQSKREGDRGVVIYSYMAHHQGMSLAALNNVLHRDALQRRFHSDLRIRAVETLLFEGIPITQLSVEEIRIKPSPVRTPPSDDGGDRVWTEETAVPRTQLFGNGHCSLMVTNSGGGYLRWNEFDITRWRSDPTLDPWGTFIYIRDISTDEIWATSHKPFTTRIGESAIRFAADRAEYRRRVSGIESVMEITAAEEDDAVLRRVRVTNRSTRARQLEFTSFYELAMTPHAADKAHPAFAKMFVETECPEPCVLVAHRRPRSPGETPIWTALVLAGAAPEDEASGIQFETDRLKFIGRGNTPENAVALRTPLTGSVGTVIDPIFSLRCRMTLEPRDRRDIAFITIAASSREALMEAVHKYTRLETVARAFEMAWTRAQLVFRFLGIRPGDAHRYQELASQLLYPNPRLRPSPDRLARNRLGQQALWAHGISGDLPIVLVTIAEARNMPLVRDVLLAHAYWRLRGFKADLVILDQEGTTYDAPLRHQLQRQIEAHASDAGMDRPGGVFLRDWNAFQEEQRTLLMASAAIVLSGSRGSLLQQLASVVESLPVPLLSPTAGIHEEPSQPLPFLELPYFNGFGGFTQDGREYATYLAPGATTPAPWVNVMANPDFGAMVSESGLGFTWFGNSQTNRITPWHNDPVSDPQSEAIYIRDEETGRFWTPTALPIREKDAYRARHGQGYTVFEHNSHAIAQELTVFVPVAQDGTGDPVKICRLRLTNQSSRRRQLRATWFAELVLGSSREEQQLHIQTSRDEATGALIARQFWTGSWCGQFVFAAATPRAVSWSTDRTQFLGRNASKEKPAALSRIRLDNRALSTGDPAAALQVALTLEPGQQTDVTFLLGQAVTMDRVREIVDRYSDPVRIEQALTGTRAFWDSVLGALQVKTPVLSTDLLLNRWLLYQVLSCRFWGRSALYQSGGAFGFRDQLQDSMAFLDAAPQITRRHILVSAARQFPEGDAQHWWHPDTGNGVRTLCSDDFLWLPYVVAQYVRVTGDAGILDEEVLYIEGPPLKPGEHEHMFVPVVSAQAEPLWEHCRRALDHGWQLGPHGLPLMGNGDWNDGMNLVGAEGKGESVWVAWFLSATLESFASVMESRDAGRSLASEWRQKAATLKKRTEQVAWDGEWYLRAFFDNGAPLGSHANEEARIDSLPQSWAVISGAQDTARSRRAMESAEANLVRERDKLVLLFTPPFDHSQPNPGYIMGYPPGLRENGGQYTHGSMWMALAWATLREGARAVRLLQLMNPVEHSRHPEAAVHYRGEPYVVAADVYDAPGRVGQCGWTWYTGSAAWMYRIWTEEVLGFRLRGDRLTIDPAIPDEWPGFELTYRYRSTVYDIKVQRREGEKSVPSAIELKDDGGRHEIVVWLPGAKGVEIGAGAREVAVLA
jgi:cyclic beta-1,2-glucan synthetase